MNYKKTANFIVCLTLIFSFSTQMIFAASIPGFESADTNGNLVPDYLEARVSKSDGYITVEMTDGRTLDWAEMLVPGTAYQDVLTSVIPGQTSTWAEDGWRFAVEEEVYDLFSIFGARSLGPHTNTRHPATDLSRLLGETTGCQPQSDDICDYIDGYLYSDHYGAAAAAYMRDSNANAQLARSSYAIINSPLYSSNPILRPFDYSNNRYGAWLVRGDNVAPNFYGLDDSYTVEVGVNATVDFIAYDVNNDEISVVVQDLPIGASFSSTTNSFEWTPRRSQVGVHTVTFVVTDDGSPSLATEKIVTFEVFSTTVTATTTLEVIHDTYSTTFAPGVQKGNVDWIRVQDINKVTGQYKHMHRGFVQVDTTTIPVDATVATATMRMYVSEAAQPGPVMVQLPTTAWDEATLTMNNVPDVDYLPITTFDVTTVDVGTYVELDVTDLVSDWVSGTSTNHGVMLSPLGTAVEFGTKESGEPVSIEVSYQTN